MYINKPDSLFGIYNKIISIALIAQSLRPATYSVVAFFYMFVTKISKNHYSNSNFHQHLACVKITKNFPDDCRNHQVCPLLLLKSQILNLFNQSEFVISSPEFVKWWNS